MSSVDGYYKCPKCGNEQAIETYWGHTGEYVRSCEVCGWKSMHMLDYNAIRRIYTNVMPIDKSVLDVDLPDLSDVKFYNNMDNQLFSEIKKFRDMSDYKCPFGSKDMHVSSSLQLELFCALSCIINPIRQYIFAAAEAEPEIKEYADLYSERISVILYHDVQWFSHDLNLFDTNSDMDKKARFEQFIYEFYLVEIKLFDKYKHTDAKFVSNLMSDYQKSPLNSSDFEWIFYGYEVSDLAYAHKYIDISNIITDIRKSQGYNTFAFWTMNEYYSTFCKYPRCESDAELYEDMNMAANNIDYASGRYDEVDSTKLSLYTTGPVRDFIVKNRNVICYIHVDSNSDGKDELAIIDKYIADNKIRYHETIVNSNSIEDHYCDEFRRVLNDINSGALSKLIVIDKKHFVNNGFDIIDYFCYLNNVDLIVINDLNRKSAKDIMAEIAAKNLENYAVYVNGVSNPFGFPFNIK